MKIASFYSLAKEPGLLPKRIWRKMRLAMNPSARTVFNLGNGLKFECSLGSSTGRMLTLGHLETGERQFIHDILKPGDVFFDIGANNGIFSIVAAYRIGIEGHVYAFEASRREASHLGHNIELNGFGNVTIVNQAVSNRSGTASFAICSDGGSNSLARNDNPEQQIESWQQVEMVTLDHFIAGNTITRVAAVKIDVEGAECDVLEGGKVLFGREDAPVVICEFCDATLAGFNKSGQKLYDMFTRYGYQLYELMMNQQGKGYTLKPSPAKQKYSFENLIAVKPLQDARHGHPAQVLAARI